MKTKKIFKIMATYYDMMSSQTKSVPMPHSENSVDFLNDEDVKFDADYLTTEMPKAKIPSRKHMEEFLDKEFGENTDDDSLFEIHASDEELLHGGLGDDVDDDMFDDEELEEGIDEEMEHTDKPEIAKEIAKDHLMEDENYYTKHDDFEDFLEYEV